MGAKRAGWPRRALVAALALTMILTSCAAGPQSAPAGPGAQDGAAGREPQREPKTIRITLPSVSMNFLHPEVANEAGLAAAEGLAFEVSHAQQGTNKAAASLRAG